MTDRDQESNSKTDDDEESKTDDDNSTTKLPTRDEIAKKAGDDIQKYRNYDGDLSKADLREEFYKFENRYWHNFG